MTTQNSNKTGAGNLPCKESPFLVEQTKNGFWMVTKDGYQFSNMFHSQNWAIGVAERFNDIQSKPKRQTAN